MTLFVQKMIQRGREQLELLANGKIVSISLWNDLATTTGQELLDMVDSSPVVAIKSLQVSDFQGVSLSTIGKSALAINPDLPEAQNLKSWYDSEGKDTSLAPVGADMVVARAGGFKSMYSDRVFLSHITSDPAMGQEKEALQALLVSFSWHRASVANIKILERDGLARQACTGRTDGQRKR